MSPTTHLHDPATDLHDPTADLHDRTTDLHDRSTLTAQRDAIRRLLINSRPALAHRVHEGPSGALTIGLPGGGTIEIGRMRRRGDPRWVVVAPCGSHLPGRVRITDSRTATGIVRAVLRALDELAADGRILGRPHGHPSLAPATVTA